MKDFETLYEIVMDNVGMTDLTSDQLARHAVTLMRLDHANPDAVSKYVESLTYWKRFDSSDPEIMAMKMEVLQKANKLLRTEKGVNESSPVPIALPKQVVDIVLSGDAGDYLVNHAGADSEKLVSLIESTLKKTGSDPEDTIYQIRPDRTVSKTDMVSRLNTVKSQLAKK